MSDFASNNIIIGTIIFFCLLFIPVNRGFRTYLALQLIRRAAEAAAEGRFDEFKSRIESAIRLDPKVTDKIGFDVDKLNQKITDGELISCSEIADNLNSALKNDVGSIFVAIWSQRE